MTPSYVLRHMRLEDIPQVVEIDKLSFSTPWPARTYEFEIMNRDASHFCVVEAQDGGERPPRGAFGLRRLWPPKPATPASVVGYGGCWLIAGEAHISTIAVHPAFRGQGLGELLLAGMLLRSLNLEGQYSVLEVRASNASAQQLYRKYEYEVVGRRRGYYRDDGEDALLMEVRPLDEGYHERLCARIRQLEQHVVFANEFSAVETRAE